MRVLVTGASGYIGSHVCKQLSENNHSVTGWDIELHTEYNNVSMWCDSYAKQDITESNLKGDFDAVVHLAGRSIVPYSFKEPTEYYRNNIMGTANLTKCFPNVNNFIFASTSAIAQLNNPYAISKLAAEHVIKENCENHTIFRFFNVSGTDGVNRQLGEATHLIRVAAQVAAGVRTHINVYGTDYDTRDGTCLRDYIHVTDLTNAIVKAVEHGAANSDYECLGTNTGYSVLEVIDAMKKVTGKNIPIKFCNRRPGDSEANLVDKVSNYVSLTKDINDMCESQFILETQLKRDKNDYTIFDKSYGSRVS